MIWVSLLWFVIFLVLLIVAGVLVMVLVPDPTTPAKKRGVAKLYLDKVRDKAMSRNGWTNDKARSLEVEYRDFLMLIAENPTLVISPWSDDLDKFWHEHILDTRQYDADCKRIFGRKIQHDPHIEKNPYRHQSTVKATMDLRDKQLLTRAKRKADAIATGSPVSVDGFDLVTFGCAADPAPSHHSSSHDSGSSGHDSGSHGGHSCGGHSGGDSGGGHSCGGGHGCGGHGCGGGGCGGGH